MLLDDVGSFPLPQGMTKEWVESNYKTKEYEEMVQRAFLMKTKFLDVPNYPQFRDMVKMFIQPIKNPEMQDDAYLISKKYATIPELEYIQKLKFEKFRVCITGAFELYYREFGGVIYEDVLLNIAESVYRFARNAIKLENVKCISFDEPSFGLLPDLQPEKELVERVYSKKLGVDVQVHLHEPVFYEKFLETEINLIGIESARNPDNLIVIDKELLESSDKKLRIGVARTDIDCIINEFNDKYGLNAWKDEKLLELAVEEFESIEKIAERIKLSIDKFNELVKYLGPDCGLFSFPSQKVALKLLENLKKAKDLWRP
ncbi:MAG: 5-methyltetrahydropteroyltriglutamate--homocysteine methyltransferase [Archaeoglobaceae archaeon]|nr:5-methyltetrahydropteroyltriglutamate--homocysteine methyltransferase [Archaeoglobaceae archaeon]MDW7989441.1 5-methyltetrahydropteroyltriglutamate--homocysteine methyltransferase [Archaeoglobaceae archaeon]